MYPIYIYMLEMCYGSTGNAINLLPLVPISHNTFDLIRFAGANYDARCYPPQINCLCQTIKLPQPKWLAHCVMRYALSLRVFCRILIDTLRIQIDSLLIETKLIETRALTWSVATVPMHVNGSLKYEQTCRKNKRINLVLPFSDRIGESYFTPDDDNSIELRCIQYIVRTLRGNWRWRRCSWQHNPL